MVDGFYCVVIIGFGVVILIGNMVQDYWNGFIFGSNGVDVIILFDVFVYVCCFVVEVKDFDLFGFIELKEVKCWD